MLQAVCTACVQSVAHNLSPVPKSCCPPCQDGPQPKSASCCFVQGRSGLVTLALAYKNMLMLQ
eukprot:7299276-Heterocapsa_arctica.AAC.1